MAENILLYEVKDQIAFITLNRPEKRNAINIEMCIELGKVWERFEQDPEARVGIVSGNGKSFSTGADLSGSTDLVNYLYLVRPPNGITVFKPIISAVHGYIAGLAYGLAIQGCDLTVAADTAHFGFPEPKVGIAGGIVEYTPYMPFKISMEFYLTGEWITAQRAYELGLVNRVAPEAEIINEAVKLAEILKKNAPLTLRSIKFGHYKALNNIAAQAKREFLAYVQPQIDSEDIQEGMSAFLEKREPIFKGR